MTRRCPRLPRHTRLATAAGAAAVALLLAACVRETPPPAVADRIDRLGALEVITRTRHHVAGDSGRFGSSQSWRLRWQGQPVVIDTRGGLFGDQPQRADTVNALFVLPAAPEAASAPASVAGAAPVVIVNVGDPNNTSAFHLLRQDGTALATPLLCLGSGGDNAVGWLGSRSPWQGPQFQTLGPPPGLTLLMLGNRCLYDTAARRVLRVPETPDMSVWSSVPPLALSPDDRSLVRFGSVDGVAAPWREAEQPEPVPHLLVAELEPADGWPQPPAGAAPRDRWQSLPIDRGRMRYADHETDIDASWLARHFEWRRGADGRDRLAPRVRFEPLPWRGVFREHGGGEYKVDRARQDLRPALLALMRGRYGASPLPATGGDERYTRLMLRGETLVLNPLGFHAESAARYFPGQPGDPALQRALVREIAAAFDAELASGRHDALFRPGTAPGPR